jgi:pSer/pThr/pTyr-binding forkhead associated (FHA) protein
MERLVLTWVGKPVAFELMPGLNRVGRNPTNDCRVADASISSFHAEITLKPDNTVHVRDLASTNGTHIDGVPILEGEVKPGQSLRFGTVEFTLERVTVAEPVRTPEPVLAGGSDNTESWSRDEKPNTFMDKLTRTIRIGFKK